MPWMTLINLRDFPQVINKEGHCRYQNFSPPQWGLDCSINELMGSLIMKLIVLPIIASFKRFWILNHQRVMMSRYILETFLESRGQKVWFKERFKFKQRKMILKKKSKLLIIQMLEWINSRDCHDELIRSIQRVMMKWIRRLKDFDKSKWSTRNPKSWTNQSYTQWKLLKHQSHQM